MPSGTYQALQEFEAQCKADGLTFDERYERMHDHPFFQSHPIDQLDNFLTFGWGRLSVVMTTVDLNLDQWSGSTNDAFLVKRILSAQALATGNLDLLLIEPEVVEGLCWS